MKQSTNRFKNGVLWNGYDYSEQVWVVDGAYQDCGHAGETRKRWGGYCCRAHELAGQPVPKGKQTEVARP